MHIQWPASFVINNTVVIIVVAVVGILVFGIIFVRSIAQTIKSSARRLPWAKVRGVLAVCLPLLLALIAAFAAALIWPKLGIAKDAFQTTIEGVPLQVDGQPGVFTVVYIGAIILFSKLLPGILMSQSKPGNSSTPQIGSVSSETAKSAEDWPSTDDGATADSS